jgi:hypothetical protein
MAKDGRNRGVDAGTSCDMKEWRDAADNADKAFLEAMVKSGLKMGEILKSFLGILLKLVGDCDMTILLPASTTDCGDYYVAGHVNNSFEKSNVGVFHQVAAEFAAGAVESCRMLNVGTVQEITEAFGRNAVWFRGRHVFSLPCMNGVGEPVAVFLMLRDIETPFSKKDLWLTQHLCNVLGGEIDMVNRIVNNRLKFPN